MQKQNIKKQNVSRQLDEGRLRVYAGMDSAKLATRRQRGVPKSDRRHRGIQLHDAEALRRRKDDQCGYQSCWRAGHETHLGSASTLPFAPTKGCRRETGSRWPSLPFATSIEPSLIIPTFSIAHSTSEIVESSSRSQSGGVVLPCGTARQGGKHRPSVMEKARSGQKSLDQ